MWDRLSHSGSGGVRLLDCGKICDLKGVGKKTMDIIKILGDMMGVIKRLEKKNVE